MRRSNGVKLLTASGPNGRILPSSITHLATKRKDIHYPKPRVLSLTLPTELGTVYSLRDLSALNKVACQHDLLIHIDGARFANAVASLACLPSEIIDASGADVLCFGGTKSGLGLTETVIFFNLELAHEFGYRCKQAGQLASKMRVLLAPWDVMLALPTLRRSLWRQSFGNLVWNPCFGSRPIPSLSICDHQLLPDCELKGGVSTILLEAAHALCARGKPKAFNEKVWSMT